MTNQRAEFLRECRILIAHSRTLYELRDALSKAVAILDGTLPGFEQPPENSPDEPAATVIPIEAHAAVKQVIEFAWQSMENYTGFSSPVPSAIEAVEVLMRPADEPTSPTSGK